MGVKTESRSWRVGVGGLWWAKLADAQHNPGLGLGLDFVSRGPGNAAHGQLGLSKEEH